MTLSGFLLSEGLANRRELNDLVRKQRVRRRFATKKRRQVEQRLDSLEDSVGYLTLVLGALIAKANDRGAVTLDEIKGALGELDEIDGVADGRLDIGVLRDLTD